MLVWCVGALLALFVLWSSYDLLVRPRLFARHRQREIRALSLWSPEDLRFELIRRGCAAGLDRLYPSAPLFRDAPVQTAQELAERWDATFALASKSDAEKSARGPAGDAYLFYDGGLVTVREALDLASNTTPPSAAD
jgi:hypothetical protein